MMKSFQAPKAPANNLPFWLLALCLLAAALAVLAPRAAAAAGAGTTPELQLEVEGQPVRAEAPPFLAEGRTLVPVRFAAEALGATVTWDPARQQATIALPPRRGGAGSTVTIAPGAAAAEVDGRQVPLPVPARIVRDRTYVPLRFVAEALGAEVEWDEPTRTVRVWRRPALVTDLSWQKEVGVARVRVALSETVLAHRAEVLQNPDRLVLTLSPARVAVPNPANLLLDPLIKGIRLEQDGRAVRLVVDLNRAPDYRLRPDPDGFGFTLELGYQVTAVEVQQDGRVPVLALLSDGPLDFKVRELEHPARLVVDLAGATLGGQVPKAMTAAGLPGVTQVRTGQFSPEVARVVLDLGAPALYQVQRTHRGVFLRFPPQITGVTWQALPGRTRITLTASGPLDFTVQPDPAGRRLTVSLPGAALAAPGERKTATGAAFTAITLVPGSGPASPGAAPVTAPVTGLQAVFELPYYLGHQVQSRPGESQLVLDLISSPVYGKRIWIDAGHGGSDPGAIGPAGTAEKGVTLAVSLALRDLLEQAGARVGMTRADDRAVDLLPRAALANQAKADLFLSVHANSGSATASGIETYYASNHPASPGLASALHQSLVRGLGLPDRKVRSADYVVLVKTVMPAALVEMGFLSNPGEERLLGDPAFQRKVATALRDGIFAYYWQQINP